MSICPGFSQIPTDLLHSFSPLIGGVLSRPQDRWPYTFSHRFWADYPYFLPCLVSAAFTFLSFIILALYLEEVCCILLIEVSYAMMAPRLSIRSPHESSELLVTTLMVCREKREKVRIKTYNPKSRRSHYRCALCSRSRLSSLSSIKRC